MSFRKIAALALLTLFGKGRPVEAAITVHQVAPGVYRGLAPKTDADYQRLKQLGIKTVLNLRKRDRGAIASERQRLAALGIATQHVPMRYFPGRDGSVERAMRVMHDPALRPLYVHCKHGRDRTGLIVGLFRVQSQGWSRSRAYHEMTRYGFNTWLVGLRRVFWRSPARPVPATDLPTSPALHGAEEVAGASDSGKRTAAPPARTTGFRDSLESSAAATKPAQQGR